MVNQNLSSQKEGTGQATAEEIEAAANRSHGVDDESVITFFKELIKNSTIDIWKYGFKQLNDGWMIKLQFIQRMHGTIVGPTLIKGYFSDAIFTDLQKKILAIPKKTMKDASHPEDVDRITYPSPFPMSKKRVEPKLKLKDIWS